MSKAEQTRRTLTSGQPGHRGFSLIEVLIVLAILGIISAIAYPSYLGYVENTRRSDAHLALLSEAQNMERCKSTRYSYADCDVRKSESPEGYYDLSVVKTATTYTLTATAATGAAQVGDTDCPSLTLNETSDQEPAECWN